MTLIFDIGKTNKKVFVLDDTLTICLEESCQIPEINDEDGFPCEDLEALTAWIKGWVAQLINKPGYPITRLNFSAYGASFVHIGRDGKPVAPLYNYLKPYPDSVKEKFYLTYGSEEQIALQTASPTLGFLNSGMQLYWLKHQRPHIYKNIAVSLHLPQYLAYLFSGHYLTDITSLGCHTQLWNFNEHKYHTWVLEESIDRILAPMAHSDLCIPALVMGKKTSIGIGLHDSSAALIPYLKHFTEPFVLISTGTWCISLNPFNNEPLTTAELREDCLCYMSYQGKPVKASRLFSGHDHEVEVKRLAQYFNKPANTYTTVPYNPDWESPVTYNPELLSQFGTYENAYHALIKLLVKKQAHATGLILGKNTRYLFVDGGFSKNEIFMRLLSREFPHQQVFSTEIAQASALGALLCVNPQSEIHVSKIFTTRHYPS
ncbi:MAG: carbohydrate kinase [Bacteroidetes bacterium OLB12]|nr:MAG: carbohydrate kinase [Bacteroidetes bacterium OLB12]